MTEPKRTRQQRATEFVAALRRARNDRGKLAALRRSLSSSPRMQVDAWPVIAGMGGEIDPHFVGLAALYAVHPKEASYRNFGESCRRIAQSGSNEIVESFERRFRRLLACDDAEDLLGQLRSWVRLAASKDVGINYESLFADLLGWRWNAEAIRVQWARAFWQSGVEEEANENATNSAV